jgi:hypothetical protein
VKIALPESVAKQLRPILADCQQNGQLSPDVLAGQIRGDWEEGTEKVFLFLMAIRPATARKIRKLIERERERENGRR